MRVNKTDFIRAWARVAKRNGTTWDVQAEIKDSFGAEMTMGSIRQRAHDYRKQGIPLDVLRDPRGDRGPTVSKEELLRIYREEFEAATEEAPLTLVEAEALAAEVLAAKGAEG